VSGLSDAALRRLRDAADAPDLTGTKYEIVDRIGQGGMGTVYRARDRELHRDVALKVIRLPEASPDIAGRMLREAHTLAQLEHPGIVPIHDVGTLSDGRTFYAMKLVRGAPLDALPPDPPAERFRIIERLCEAVAFAHAHGVIHRDLKPQNVMVGPFGEVLVMDWGVAKLTGQALVSLGDAPVGGAPAAGSPTTMFVGFIAGRPLPSAARILRKAARSVSCASGSCGKGGIPASGRPTFRKSPSTLPSSSFSTYSDRVRSVPCAPRASPPWQNPQEDA